MTVSVVPDQPENKPDIPAQTGQENPGLQRVLNDVTAAKKAFSALDIVSKVDAGSKNGGGIGGYDPGAYKTMIMTMIDELIKKMRDALKSGHPVDFSVAISNILGKMTGFGSQQVGATSVIMGVGSARKAGIANMNTLAGISDNSPQYDVNPYTGEQETAKPKVSPEQALKDQITFLVNNPMTKYKLDANGKNTGKLNPSYVFFHNASNYQSYINQVTSFNNVLNPIQGPDSKEHPSMPLPDGFPPADFDDLSKFTLPPIDPSIPLNSTSSTASSWKLTTGSIAYIHHLANPNIGGDNPSTTPGLVSPAFKAWYIASFGKTAFSNLRIPPGLDARQKSFIMGGLKTVSAADIKTFKANIANDNQLIAQDSIPEAAAKAKYDTCAAGPVPIGCAGLKANWQKLKGYTDGWRRTLTGHQEGFRDQMFNDDTPTYNAFQNFMELTNKGETDISGSPGGAPTTPDSSALNAVLTGLQELSGQNDTVTNTISTFLKQQTQNLQAMQTSEKNALQDLTNTSKTMVNNTGK